MPRHQPPTAALFALCALLLLVGCSDEVADGDLPGGGEGGPQPQLVHGGAYDDDLRAIAKTANGDLVSAGYTENSGAGDWDMLLLRSGPCGEVRWARTYGGADKDLANGVVTTSDDGIAAVGRTNSFGGYVEIYVVRTDGQGKLLWSYTYGGSGHDSGTTLLQTADGGFLVMGETYNFGPGTPQAHNMIVVRVDADGKLLWERTYGGGLEGDAGFAVAHRPGAAGQPGGFAIAGATESFGQGHDDLWLLYLDASGSVEGSWAYGGPEDDEARALAPTADGGWLLTGFTRGFGANKSDIFALEVGAKGEARWMRRYGGSQKDRGYGVHGLAASQGGGWLLMGHSASFGEGMDDRLTLRINSDGKPMGAHVFGMSGDDKAVASVALGDGRVVLAGRTESFGAGQRDGWLTTVDSDGRGGCLEQPLGLGELLHEGMMPSRVVFEPATAEGAKRSDAATQVGDFGPPLATSKATCPEACE